MNTPHRFLVRCTAIAAVALAAACLVAQPQAIRTVTTLDQLLRMDPRAFSSGGKALVYVEGRTARADWGSVRALSYDSTWSGGTNISHVWSPTNGVGAWVANDRTDPIQDIRRWPVDMTGATDDTATIAAAAAACSGRTLRFPTGTNLVSSIAINSAVRLEFDQTVWRRPAGFTNYALDVFSGDVHIAGLRIHGASNSASGLRINPGAKQWSIERCTIDWLSNTNGPAVGIYIGGDTRGYVRYNTLTNFLGNPNGVIGDLPGKVVGIWVCTPLLSGAGVPQEVTIEKNVIERIGDGEDSEAVHVLGSPLAWQHGVCPVTISDNEIRDIGTSPVKLSAGGVRVIGNRIYFPSFDGLPVASGWARTRGFKIVEANLGRSYGEGNEWIQNIVEASNSDSILSLSSNEVTASRTIIRGNIIRTNSAVAISTNSLLEGILSFQSAAEDVEVVGNFITARNKGILSYAPDQRWKISGNVLFNPTGSGTNRTGAAIVLGASINAYNVGLQDGFMLSANFFHHWTTPLLAYNITNGVFGGGNQLIDTGPVSLQRNGVDQAGAAVTYTNQLKTTFDWSIAARFGVFGEQVRTNALGLFEPPTPKGTYDIETTARPIWLRPIADESSGYARQTDAGQLAFFDNSKSISWNDGTAWAYPVQSSFRVVSGYTSNSWYRVARSQTTGLGNRYGATIILGAAGGTAGTFPTTITIDQNYAEPTVRIQNVPVDGVLAGSLAKAVRVVKDATNETAYVDIQASGTSAASWSVQVVPDVTGPALFPDRIWRVAGLTNVAALAPTETATLTVAGMSNRVASISQVGREVVVDLIGTNFVIRAPVVDIQGTLLNNSAPLSGGGGTSVKVNGSTVSNPDLNATTPAAPSGAVNVRHQVSGSSVSSYVYPSKKLLEWTALDYIPAIANGATFTTRSIGGALKPAVWFNPTTDSTGYWEGVIPDGFDPSGGVDVVLLWDSDGTTPTNGVTWSVTATNLCCGSTATSTVNLTANPSGVQYEETNSVVSLSSFTSAQPRGRVRLKVTRLPGDGGDSNTNGTGVVALQLRAINQ